MLNFQLQILSKHICMTCATFAVWTQISVFTVQHMHKSAATLTMMLLVQWWNFWLHGGSTYLYDCHGTAMHNNKISKACRRFACLGPQDHDACSTASTLASASTMNHLQALTFDASCQHHMCSIILGGVCHSSSCTQFQVMSLLCKQLSLRATKMCPLHAHSFANALLHSPDHTNVTPSLPYCRNRLRTS